MEISLLNADGYKLLSTLTVERIQFAVWVMAHYDLTKYRYLDPTKLTESRGIWRLTPENIAKRIDDLVIAQFFEYGPFVRIVKGKTAPTVRINPFYILSTKDIEAIEKGSIERTERAILNQLSN